MASSPVPVMPAQVSAASYGRLQLAVTGRNDYTPIENAVIQVTDTGNPDNVIEELTTDNSGETPTIELPAPPVSYSLESSSAQPYSEYNFTVQAEGYSNLTISGAQILANVTALQSARLMPLANIEASPIVVPPHTLYGNFPPKIAEAEIKDVTESGEVVLSRVVVPETIIVHDDRLQIPELPIIIFHLKNISKTSLPVKSTPPGRNPPLSPTVWPLSPSPLTECSLNGIAIRVMIYDHQLHCLRPFLCLWKKYF